MKNSLDRIREQIRDLRLAEDRQRGQGQSLWRSKDPAQEQAERDKRALSRGKIARGPMFRHKPMGALKQEIEELTDQLEDNN